MTTEPTKDQMDRAREHWSDIAGEMIQLQHIKGTIYAFDSVNQ